MSLTRAWRRLYNEDNNELSGAFGMYGGEERYIQDLVRRYENRRSLERDVDGRIILI
jgi:predicted metal-dependent hydrolase